MDTVRDLGQVELWQESLERSLARRGRTPRTSLELARLRPDRNITDEEFIREYADYWRMRREASARRPLMPAVGVGGAVALLAVTLPSLLGGRGAARSQRIAFIDHSSHPVSHPRISSNASTVDTSQRDRFFQAPTITQTSRPVHRATTSVQTTTQPAPAPVHAVTQPPPTVHHTVVHHQTLGKPTNDADQPAVHQAVVASAHTPTQSQSRPAAQQPAKTTPSHPTKTTASHATKPQTTASHATKPQPTKSSATPSQPSTGGSGHKSAGGSSSGQSSSGKSSGAGSTSGHSGSHKSSGHAGSGHSGSGHKSGGGSSSGQSGSHSSGYANPLAHASVTPERIDQGVDYSGSGTLDAIGSGTVTYAATAGTGWPGAFIEYRLSSGADAGRYVYYAESVVPASGLHVGESVSPGQAIATITGGIEIGWGAGIGTESYAMQQGQWCSGCDSGNVATPAGKDFSALIASLGGPPGIVEG